MNYKTRNTEKKIERDSIEVKDIENISFDNNEYGFHEMKVDKLKIALNRIAPDEKMILLLKYQDLLSIKEIVDVLNISESATKMRIKRAKEKLILVYKNMLNNE